VKHAVLGSVPQHTTFCVTKHVSFVVFLDVHSAASRQFREFVVQNKIPSIIFVKGNFVPTLNQLIKHYAMKTYRGVDV
jgi:hypothetical protein